ncbi:glycosyltransferase family 4 protein [Patescibacteria group bacterium]|nr:glycosyltransferase family 4 protein [Patescibacteria group bacterium]
MIWEKHNIINVILFIDNYPIPSGGMEMHAHAFMQHFKNHSRIRIQHVIAFSNSPHDVQNNKDGILVLPKSIIHNPNGLITALRKVGISDHGVFFFNSLYWIETLAVLKKTFPDTVYIQRSGGNDIMQSRVPAGGNTLAERQKFVVSTLNAHLDTLIINSEYTRSRFKILGICDALMYTIVGGVDTKIFHPITKDQQRILRLNMQLPLDKTIILSVCRMVSFKGLPYLICAIAKLAARNIHYIIVGDGPEKQRIQTLIDQNGLQDSVTLVGEIPMQDIHKYYKASDIYALTPIEELVIIKEESYIRTETMGRSFCEAIATNLPIVASLVGGIPEVLKKYPHAVLVSQQNTVATTHAIMTKLEPCYQYIKSNITLPNTHSWYAIFNTYEQLFTTTSAHRHTCRTRPSNET